MRSSILAAAALAVTSVSAHGNITFPPARLPGPAMLAACGQAAVNTVLGDGTIALEEVKPASNKCNVGLCRGAVFEDNRDRVQTFSLGQVVVIEVALTIPHEGPANISIVQTSTNKIIGDMLLFFNTYADEKLAELPANNTAFGVTIPTGKAGEAVAQACRSPGDCVIQWWWLGTDAKQTYESCIDFVLAPAGPGGPNAAVLAAEGQRRLGGALGSGASATVASVSPDAAATPTSNGAVASSDNIEAGAAAPAPDSFGGVQGTVSVSDAGSDEVSAADVGEEDSFGGVEGFVPAPVRRSRVFRGRY